MIHLPLDVLHLVCEEVSKSQDFNTLFNCALAGKILVQPSLLWLYRIYLQSPIISSEGNDANLAQYDTFQERVKAQKTILLKWALLWKSIIRSSLGTTAYPYCLYIRSLDLRNLTDLLEDLQCRDEALDNFFAGDMTRFLRFQDTPMKQKMSGATWGHKRLHVLNVLELVGNCITYFMTSAASRNRATVAVEDLSGNMRAAALANWTSRFSKLKSLTLWDAAALDESVAAAISKSCYKFDDLTFYTCSRLDTDHDLASFFGGLRANTLRSFAALSANAMGPETLLSLNHHAKSLKKLKLDGLRSDAVENLSSLQGCTALESIELSDHDGVVDMEETVFLEVITWLGRCEGIQELLLRNFISGPEILTQVCLKKNIRLRKLQVIGYQLADNEDFHRALSRQTSLESLELRADCENGYAPCDEVSTLVSSICQLTNLKYLDLLTTSDCFHFTSEILTLTAHLPQLEELSISGIDIGDDLWYGVSQLHNLRSLNIHAITVFTFDGMMDYIYILQDTNRGLVLSVMNQLARFPLSRRQEGTIRQTLAARVDGKFEFNLYWGLHVDSEVSY